MELREVFKQEAVSHKAKLKWGGARKSRRESMPKKAAPLAILVSFQSLKSCLHVCERCIKVLPRKYFNWIKELLRFILFWRAILKSHFWSFEWKCFSNKHWNKIWLIRHNINDNNLLICVQVIMCLLVGILLIHFLVKQLILLNNSNKKLAFAKQYRCKNSFDF